MRYFHGSNSRLETGTVLTPRGAAYEADWKHSGFYDILEMHRPPEAMAHRNAVFMVGEPDDVDLAGGGIEWMFEVEPQGAVTRHDLNWSSEISCLTSEGHGAESPAIAAAARSYWNGTPHRDESVWEYLAEAASIVHVDRYEDFEIQPAGPTP